MSESDELYRLRWVWLLLVIVGTLLINLVGGLFYFFALVGLAGGANSQLALSMLGVIYFLGGLFYFAALPFLLIRAVVRARASLEVGVSSAFRLFKFSLMLNLLPLVCVIVLSPFVL